RARRLRQHPVRAPRRRVGVLPGGGDQLQRQRGADHRRAPGRAGPGAPAAPDRRVGLPLARAFGRGRRLCRRSPHPGHRLRHPRRGGRARGHARAVLPHPAVPWGARSRSHPGVLTFTPDVIVVGAGSAGCALTRRLVDAGVNVLLLEAGGPDDNPAIHEPARFHELWLAPEDWAYYTTPQPQAADRSLHWPRGRVLGGSSCLNGLIHVRGARSDYEAWVALGAEGWGWDDVLPVFVRMEDFDGGASALHGTGGPLRIMSRYDLAPLHAAFIAAAQEIGVTHNPDYNSGVLDGVSQMQLTIRDGRRDSAAAAYLRPVVNAPNLRVVTGAHAHRLLLEGPRCTGVEYAHDGDLHRAHAAGEVVVCAGAIEPPALLLRSGIGPAGDLRALGIEVIADLPGVGRNLHDHLLSPSIWSAERAIVPFEAGLSPIQTHLWWRSRADLPGPDTQPIHFSVPLY